MNVIDDSIGMNDETPLGNQIDEGADCDFDINAESHHMADEDQIEHGWPGDGSGLDDLADYNQNEADDYRNE